MTLQMIRSARGYDRVPLRRVAHWPYDLMGPRIGKVQAGAVSPGGQACARPLLGYPIPARVFTTTARPSAFGGKASGYPSEGLAQAWLPPLAVRCEEETTPNDSKTHQTRTIFGR